MTHPAPAYLVTLQEGGHYLGGLMVTDHLGIPKEFKYTDPVSPTKVQRIIYGSVLERYIRDHVIIGALVKEVAGNPSFYVVPQHQLIDIEDAVNLPLVALQRTQFPALPERGSTNRSKENETLLQGWVDPHPVRIMFGGMAPEQQEAVLKDLIHLSKTMDLIEPFERLERAVKDIHQDKA